MKARPGRVSCSERASQVVESMVVAMSLLSAPVLAWGTMSLERPQVEKPDGDIPFELGIEDIVVGEGDEATSGKKVSVHYVGVAFSTGEEFDASWNRGKPFEFKLGKGQVIPGWDAGVQGMKVGGRRKLTIPSAMAYGARGAGGVIKPHEPLVFVVDLLSVS